MIEYVTIGEITLDDTVLETDEIRRDQTGGGSVYSALGLRLWGHQVGINSVVGHEYPPAYLDFLNAGGISTEGVHRIPGWSLRLWLLHEEENRKQQLPKILSSSFDELDEARLYPPQNYLTARGYHLAPATPRGQMKARDWIRRHVPHALISLDLLTAAYIDPEPYRSGAAFRGIDITSPSIVEGEALWPGEPVAATQHRLRDWGVRWVAIKMDTRGARVYDAVQDIDPHIPIYPAQTVDVTGAGDAFAGGFLEGISETGDVRQAGVRGTVSASFTVECWGAFDLLKVSAEQANEREAWLIAHL